MGDINAIQGLGALTSSTSTGKIDQSNSTSFKETLAGFMQDVNSMQNQADQSIEKMATGEITDVHQVMNSVEEAKTAFNMMMEIRNKVMSAYEEVMRMRL